MRQAREDPTAEAMHEWRKRVKYHSYHLRLLEPVWPAMLKAQVGAAKRLEELLGDHHDLDVFMQTLAGDPAAFGDVEKVETIRSLGHRRREELENEAFARGFGIASGSIDDLRREVEANLKLELKRTIDARVKAQALAGLRQRATFAVPKALVEGEAELLRQRAIASIRERPNVKPEDLELSLDVFRPQAEERVALGLIIGELVRAEGLQAKPEQIKALVTETAQTYEQPEAVVRWHYEKPERLRDFEAMALEQNVVDWIVARARVTDEPTTFEQVMSQRSAT